MKLTSLAAAAALSLAAGAALAQPAPTGPRVPDMPMRMQGRDPAQMAEQHAQRLRDALQLRPDQEPALRALTASMQPSEADRQRMRGEREAMRNLTTPQRLDRMQAMMGEREARFRQHAEAIKRFYAQLTPAQQKAFDAMPMMMGPGMGGHGMGMRERRGPGMKHEGAAAMPRRQPPAPPPGR